MDYRIVGIGNLVIDESNTAFATQAANRHFIRLKSDTPDVFQESVTVLSLSPNTPTKSESLPISYTVLNHANGSWSSVSDQNELSLELGSYLMDDHEIKFDVNLFNLTQDQPTSSMILNDSNWDDGQFELSSHMNSIAAGDEILLQGTFSPTI